MTMPTTGFNVPRGSFPTPQKPVGVGPLVGPLVEVKFNYKWCSLIVGSLSQLLLTTTWDVETQAELTAIQQDVFDLMASFCVNPPAAGVTPNTGAEGGDDFMLRQNPDNPCELQTSVNGTDWCTWADLSKCISAAPQQGAPAPQPAPGGGCQKYHVFLPANGKYLLPTVVNTGDTLLIENLKGASNDGTLSPWYCGDGNLFFAGACLGSSTTQSGDPLPANPHLMLIAEAGGLFFNVLGGTISIGSIAPFQNLTFQVNDSILTDNSGSLEFDVTICNEQAATWSHTFDFLTSNGGFFALATPGGHTFGQWIAGVGWVSEYAIDGIGTDIQLRIRRNFVGTITQVQEVYDGTIATTYDMSYDGIDPALGTVIQTGTSVVGTDENLIAPGLSDSVTSNYRADFGSTGGAASTDKVTLTSITISGTGTNPFV